MEQIINSKSWYGKYCDITGTMVTAINKLRYRINILSPVAKYVCMAYLPCSLMYVALIIIALPPLINGRRHCCAASGGCNGKEIDAGFKVWPAPFRPFMHHVSTNSTNITVKKPYFRLRRGGRRAEWNQLHGALKRHMHKYVAGVSVLQLGVFVSCRPLCFMSSPTLHGWGTRRTEWGEQKLHWLDRNICGYPHKCVYSFSFCKHGWFTTYLTLLLIPHQHIKSLESKETSSICAPFISWHKEIESRI